MRTTAILRQRGISMLEVTLAFTLILSLSAVVVPTGRRKVAEIGTERAAEDCRQIAVGLVDYVADTGQQPTGSKGARTWSWLRGPGQICDFRVFPNGQVAELSWFMMGAKDIDLGSRWAGPYLDRLGTDPWGRHYVVLLQGLGQEVHAERRVWVLSAGADGVIETRPEDAKLIGDDIGLRLDL